MDELRCVCRVLWPSNFLEQCLYGAALIGFSRRRKFHHRFGARPKYGFCEISKNFDIHGYICWRIYMLEQLLRF